MTDEDGASRDEELQEVLRRLLQQFGGGQIDPALLAQLNGAELDPAVLPQLITQLQGLFAGGGVPVWESATRAALHLANQSDRGVSDGQRVDLEQAFALADLWLSEATTVPELSTPPRAITRGQWVEETMPVWRELAEPVSTSIADALSQAIATQTPEEMRHLLNGADQLMHQVGGSLFAAQFGQVVGRLSLDVISGGDVGIPLLPAGEAAILPQNFADFGQGLDIPGDQLSLYAATRELAHARLFRHAKWLRLDVSAQVSEVARGTTVDLEALEDLASRFDPSEPEELRRALESGALLSANPQREVALARLEDVLALVEGWVEVVTADATGRLPEAMRIAEVVRRRRAVAGPAEKALSALVGLELRPRRMREAAAMWRSITDAVGTAARDTLWDYPDLMPTGSDIDDPSTVIERLRAVARGDSPVTDDFDAALAQLLAEESGGDTPGDEGPAGPPAV